MMSNRLGKVQRIVRGMLPVVSKFDRVEVSGWIDGVDRICELLEHSEGWETECSICAGIEFINSQARLPFMVGIYILEDWQLLARCLEVVRMCWGIDGDKAVEKVTKWIEGLLEMEGV